VSDYSNDSEVEIGDTLVGSDIQGDSVRTSVRTSALTWVLTRRHRIGRWDTRGEPVSNLQRNGGG